MFWGCSLIVLIWDFEFCQICEFDDIKILLYMIFCFLRKVFRTKGGEILDDIIFICYLNFVTYQPPEGPMSRWLRCSSTSQLFLCWWLLLLRKFWSFYLTCVLKIFYLMCLLLFSNDANFFRMLTRCFRSLVIRTSYVVFFLNKTPYWNKTTTLKTK